MSVCGDLDIEEREVRVLELSAPVRHQGWEPACVRDRIAAVALALRSRVWLGLRQGLEMGFGFVLELGLGF